MQGSLDKQRRGTRNPYRNWNVKLLALPILFIVALIGFAISHPDTSTWIAAAVQAEFAGSDFVPDLAAPARVAQPSNEVRTVKVY